MYSISSLFYKVHVHNSEGIILLYGVTVMVYSYEPLKQVLPCL